MVWPLREASVHGQGLSGHWGWLEGGEGERLQAPTGLEDWPDPYSPLPGCRVGPAGSTRCQPARVLEDGRVRNGASQSDLELLLLDRWF